MKVWKNHYRLPQKKKILFVISFELKAKYEHIFVKILWKLSLTGCQKRKVSWKEEGYQDLKMPSLRVAKDFQGDDDEVKTFKILISLHPSWTLMNQGQKLWSKIWIYACSKIHVLHKWINKPFLTMFEEINQKSIFKQT